MPKVTINKCLKWAFPGVIHPAKDSIHVSIAEQFHLGQFGVQHFSHEILQQAKVHHI
jgi:hypothetical protein